MKIISDLTDEAVLRELGVRLERRRIDAGLTQAELAEQAGISKRTLERIETGRGTDSTLLIRTLRVLKLLAGLETLIPDLPQSPIVLLKTRGQQPKRVRRRRKASRPAGDGEPPSKPWKWGE